MVVREETTSQFKYEMEDKKYCTPVYPVMSHLQKEKSTKVEEKDLKKTIQTTERDKYDNKIDEWHVGTRTG